MRVYTLKLALIIAIINSANAWWDIDLLMSIPFVFRAGDELVETGKGASGKKGTKQSIKDSLVALAKLKIDVNSLNDYIPLVEAFDRMLDDCIASRVPQPPEKDNNDKPPVKIIPPEEFSSEDSPPYYDDHNDFVYGEMYRL